MGFGKDGQCYPRNKLEGATYLCRYISFEVVLATGLAFPEVSLKASHAAGFNAAAAKRSEIPSHWATFQLISRQRVSSGARPADWRMKAGLTLRRIVMNCAAGGLMKRAQILQPRRLAAANYADWFSASSRAS